MKNFEFEEEPLLDDVDINLGDEVDEFSALSEMESKKKKKAIAEKLAKKSK